MNRAYTGKSFWIELRHLLEDPSYTGPSTTILGHAVATAVDVIAAKCYPHRVQPNATKATYLTPSDKHSNNDFLAKVGITSTDVYAVEVPDDIGHIISIVDGNYEYVLLGTYDEYQFKYASSFSPLATLMGGYLVTSSDNEITVTYERKAFEVYDAGSGVFATASGSYTLTDTEKSWSENQWEGALIWQADSGGDFTESTLITASSNTSTLVKFPTAVDIATRNYRLFQKPDVAPELMTAVMYQAALIVDGEDPTNGLWLNVVEAAISNFIANRTRDTKPQFDNGPELF